MESFIREYNKSDKQRCLECFKSNVPLYFTEDEILDFENFLSSLEKANNRTYFYVLIKNENVIGCGGFGDKNNTDTISLAWGLIHIDFHKFGFGKQLLLHRLDQIIKLKPKQPIVIDTTQYSFGFFEKFGFRTTLITNDYYIEGMHRYDMELNLDKYINFQLKSDN